MKIVNLAWQTLKATIAMALGALGLFTLVFCASMLVGCNINDPHESEAPEKKSEIAIPVPKDSIAYPGLGRP